MRILLAPMGTHGDVHPFVGMGIELARRGHDVRVIASPYFQSLIERAGLPLIPFGTVEEFREAVENPIVWHPTEGFRFLLGYVASGLRPLYQLIAEHYVPGETLVVNSPLGMGARLAHEKLGTPLITLHLAPSSLRSVADPVVLPGIWLPRWSPAFLTRFIYWLGDRVLVGPVLEGPLNEFRAELGLPPIRRPMAGWWNSPQRVLGLFPEWYAPPAPDWPTQTRLCGFPLFDERGLVDLPPELDAFLQASDPPLLFTPGSAMRHGQAFFQAAVEACQRLGRRGIFLTMHADHLPERLPDTIRHFHYIPFSQVFPRVAVVVHHGGIGTTAQGLAAGVPQLIMPMGYDQPDNALRLKRLGVGDALPVRRFTGPNLAKALVGLLDPEVRARCQELAHRLPKESPVAAMCDFVESVEIRPLSTTPENSNA